jgi:hypothetical protein
MFYVFCKGAFKKIAGEVTNLSDFLIVFAGLCNFLSKKV